MKYNLGVEQMNENNFSEAISLFDSALTYNHNFILAHFNKGLCHFKLENFDASKSIFARLLLKDSSFHLAYFQLAEIYKKQRFNTEQNLES